MKHYHPWLCIFFSFHLHTAFHTPSLPWHTWVFPNSVTSFTAGFRDFMRINRVVSYGIIVKSIQEGIRQQNSKRGSQQKSTIVILYQSNAGQCWLTVILFVENTKVMFLIMYTTRLLCLCFIIIVGTWEYLSIFLDWTLPLSTYLLLVILQ